MGPSEKENSGGLSGRKRNSTKKSEVKGSLIQGNAQRPGKKVRKSRVQKELH